MRIEVAILPQLVTNLDRTVCIVIDVLRATSSLVEIVERGATAVWVAPSIATAREQAATRAAELEAGNIAGGSSAGVAVLLCGESGGLPPAGFDYGNSPSEFAGMDLASREVILCTSNGTKALRAVAGAPAVFAGALLNAQSVVDAAVSLAIADGLDLALVCSGKDLGTSYSLEDTYIAGCLVGLARAATMGVAPPTDAGFSPTDGDLASLEDSALAALRLVAAYRGDHRQVFAESVHGRYLDSIGLGYDLDYCAQMSVRQAVPRLVRGEGEAVLIVPDRATRQAAGAPRRPDEYR